MRRFAALFDALDASTATGDKVAALLRYFADAPAPDAAWAVYFLAGGKPRQVVPTACCAAPPVPRPASTTGCSRPATRPWATWPRPSPTCCRRPRGAATAAWRTGSSSGCCHCAALAPEEQAARLRQALRRAGRAERFLLVKLIGGGFRVGVSKLLVQRALAQHAGLDAKRRGAAPDGLDRRPRQRQRRALPTPGERRRRRLPMPASPTPSSWRMRCRPSRPRWARWPTGWWNGSTTASARSWCAGPAVLDLVARRGADDRALPRGGGTRPRPARRHACSTASCWCGARATPCRRRSACCSSASAARR
jgi:hypothetical protein